MTTGAPKAIQELVPKAVSLSTVVRVLQDLLEEQVPIRDMKTILETLAEKSPGTNDPTALLRDVRCALGTSITHKINGLNPELPAFTLAPKLEQILQQGIRQSMHDPLQGGQNPAGPESGLPAQDQGNAGLANQPANPTETAANASAGIEPNLGDQVITALTQETRRREAAGDPAILLVPDAIRAWVARFTRPAIPELNVLAYNEVPPNRKIRLVATVGG